MKSIAVVNTEIPTIENPIQYHSGESLLDFDIVVFDPEFPYESRIDFSGGGSCISIDGTQKLQKSIRHWRGELLDALKSGKTVFFLLNEYEADTATTGYTTGTKGARSYSIFSINSYEVLPVDISVRNAKGRNIKAVDGKYKMLLDSMKEISQYKVIFKSDVGSPIFTTKDGKNVVSSVLQLEGSSGHLVFLPYFNLSNMSTYDQDEGEEVWTEDALRISHSIVAQMVALDKSLGSENEMSPEPDWLVNIRAPKTVAKVDKKISAIDKKVQELEVQREIEKSKKQELLKYSRLLYETGKPLEQSIEDALKLLGYEVENFIEGSLEIDHIIVSPDGFRMIGESEGKDSSAISISKFRQLESNIGEDFEREEINKPAKGILFGNGFRFVKPEDREEQFTDKCLTNAKRLGTALVRTCDLYHVVMHILDDPNDKSYIKSCRNAIESTVGEVVEFPIYDSGTLQE